MKPARLVVIVAATIAAIAGPGMIAGNAAATMTTPCDELDPTDPNYCGPECYWHHHYGWHYHGNNEYHWHDYWHEHCSGACN